MKALTIILLLSIEYPPFTDGPAIIEGFHTMEACEKAAGQIKGAYKSMLGRRSNTRVLYRCIEIEK